MRIYKLETTDNQNGVGVTFHPSHRDAYRTAKQYEKDHAEDAPMFEIEPIDFEPTKKGVLSILTKHAPYRDNG